MTTEEATPTLRHNEDGTQPPTYYDILEVSPRATLQEIHNQYLKAKNAYSYDNPAVYSLLPSSECAEMLDKIEEAYFILSSPRKRREYDLAHGINSNYSTVFENGGSLEDVEKQNELRAEQDKRRDLQKHSLSKTIVANRFNLDYSVDEEMEQRIETATDFSGEFLKEIREYKNLTIDRMADLTKISKNYLRSIEEENFATLPATVYIRGFIFQYAKILKLPQDIVTDSYIQRVKAIREG